MRELWVRRRFVYFVMRRFFDLVWRRGLHGVDHAGRIEFQ
jgi:hypothetical protein